MNIVVLTDIYYPRMGATSACIDKYIQQLKNKHSIDIICPISRYGSKQITDSTVSIHFVNSKMWNYRLRCEENIREGRHVFINKLFLSLFRLRTLLLTPFSYPTVSSWLLKPYTQMLESIHNEKKIDVIISVVNPICTAFSAKQFKINHPEVKWINFVTDPFTFHPLKYEYLFRKQRRKEINYKNEKAIYDAADFNMFTEELYFSALNDFNQPEYKTIVMKYVLVPLCKVSSPRESSNECRLVYAGALYLKRRNPERALSVLSQIKNISTDFYVGYSNCNHIVNKYLSDKIKIYPAVDRERYNNMISNEYDILVNIGNNVKLQIPSKMMELLSTGRPIINFYQLKDVHYEMIEKYPLGINIAPDDKDAVKKVSDFCKQMKGKRLTFEEVEALFPENTLQSQLAILEHLIEAKI